MKTLGVFAFYSLAGFIGFMAVYAVFHNFWLASTIGLIPGGFFLGAEIYIRQEK